MNSTRKQVIKFTLDFLPLIMFFLSYKVAPYVAGPEVKPTVFASFVLTVSTVISMIISKLLKIKLEKFAIYSNLGVILFGILTVFFDNPVFIKAKLSIINFVFGAALLFFYFKKKPIIKALFQSKITMDDSKWNSLNLRFAIMFFLITILNVYFWLYTSEEAWVGFKTFGVLPFTLVFMILQMRFILKHGRPVEQ